MRIRGGRRRQVEQHPLVQVDSGEPLDDGDALAVRPPSGKQARVPGLG